MEEVITKIDLNNLDKSSWESFKFEEIAFKISESVDPNKTDLRIYIGLEHIDAEDIHIRRTGTPDDVNGQKLKCYQGDVIFGKRRAYLRKAAIVEFDGICSAHTFVLRANKKNIDPKLFPFFLHSDQFMHRMIDISVGGLSPTINWGDLKHQEFLLPPKEKQAEIAELLLAMDNVVEKEKVCLEKLEVFNKSKKSKILLPNENSNCELKEMNSVFEKITSKNKHLQSDNVLTISAQDGLINQEDYFKRKIASKDLSNYYLIKSGDFAYNKSYSQGYPAGAIKVLNKYESGLVSPLYICFRSNCESIYNQYYAYLFDFGYLNNNILAIAKEGARNHGLLNVSSNDFFKLKIPFPDRAYLENVMPTIISLNKSVNVLEEKILVSNNLLKKLINQIF